MHKIRIAARALGHFGDRQQCEARLIIAHGRPDMRISVIVRGVACAQLGGSGDQRAYPGTVCITAAPRTHPSPALSALTFAASSPELPSNLGLDSLFVRP